MHSIINLFVISAFTVFVMFTSSVVADAAVYVKIDGIKGDVKVASPGDQEGWFEVDSLSFGVERELKESGEKGGTADINIGIGELQEVTITKTQNSASAQLAQFSINGNSLGEVEICVTEGTDSKGNPACYLHYKLDRTFVKSWTPSSEADDRPTEEVAFFYNKIAFAYASNNNLKNQFDRDGEMSWDNVRNIKWFSGLLDIFDIIFPPEPDSDKDGIPDDIETELVGDSKALNIILKGLVKDVQASKDSTTGEINIDMQNDKGDTIFELTLPPGTQVDDNSFTSDATLVGEFYIVEVTGLQVPYPPGKKITLLADTFETTICVIDRPLGIIVGDLPECIETDTTIAQVLLDCDGFTRTFSDFPDLPASRDYSCTKFIDGANTFFIIDGLAYSSVVVVCNDPNNQLCGTDTTGSIIGGTLIPIDVTSLVLVGAQSISVWIIPIIITGVIIGLVIIRRK